VQFAPRATSDAPRRRRLIGARSAFAAAVVAWLASGCKDGPSQPTTNPTPVLLGAEPAMVITGSDGATVTLNGQDFLPTSRVRWNEGDRVTTYVSGTSLTVRLTAQDLANVGSGELVVFNPPPGGGLSGILPLTIGYPTPTISAVSPASAEFGAAETTLRITGTGFHRNSSIRWNTDYMFGTFVSPTELTAVLPQYLLTGGGVAKITVVNPTPGGGASNAVDFTVNNPVPELTSISPTSVFTGNGFTLTVNGSKFTRNSVIRWNGADRATTYVSATRLTAQIPAADVTSAGTASITVFTPAPAGGASQARTLTIAQNPLTSLQTVALRTNHIVSDPTRTLIYGSVPAGVATYGNTVVAIDPTTAAIQWSVPVGSEPGRMAVSRDGRWLYVILNGAALVVRVDLQGRTKDIEFALGLGSLGSPTYGEDIEVLPDNPAAVAVSRRNSGLSPRHEGVAVYDDGVARASATQGHTGSNRITTSATGATLYGYNNETTEFGFRRITVSSTGLQEEVVRSGLISDFGVDIEYDEGRVYVTNGAVVDPVALTRVGTFPASGIVEPDAKNGRVHFFSGTTLNSMHATEFTPVGVLTISAASGSTALIRWGTDGLAFGGGNQVVIIRSRYVVP
jgi:hypothetical protein